MPYQKLLLSATLTRNPEKLEPVNLFKPIFVSVASTKLNNPAEKVTKELVLSSDKQKQQLAKVLVKESDVPVKESLESKLENAEKSNDISVPEELTELLIEVVASQKPLLAIYLLKTLGYRRMLCFVKSIDTAKRLNKLFELNGITSMEYSSALHVARRKRVQAKFEQA